VRTEAQEISLRLSIDHDKVDPGSYNGSIEVRAPQVTTTRTPVTLSLSDSSPAWPV
jgi:hypothetical protein